ncbi:MAG: DUF3817 domain-containing protein [Acinetobacter sp.]|nr:DUF3817 domain-containing protein [Acinetobacter sp.]
MNIKTLRLVGLLEGLSFLFLLGVAMPLKYVWHNPVLMKVAGMGHGVLFLAFVFLLFAVVQKHKLGTAILVQGIIAAILPFAPFWFDKKLKHIETAQS